MDEQSDETAGYFCRLLATVAQLTLCVIEIHVVSENTCIVLQISTNISVYLENSQDLMR